MNSHGSAGSAVRIWPLHGFRVLSHVSVMCAHPRTHARLRTCTRRGQHGCLRPRVTGAVCLCRGAVSECLVEGTQLHTLKFSADLKNCDICLLDSVSSLLSVLVFLFKPEFLGTGLVWTSSSPPRPGQWLHSACMAERVPGPLGPRSCRFSGRNASPFFICLWLVSSTLQWLFFDIFVEFCHCSGGDDLPSLAPAFPRPTALIVSLTDFRHFQGARI